MQLETFYKIKLKVIEILRYLQNHVFSRKIGFHSTGMVLLSNNLFRVLVTLIFDIELLLLEFHQE